MNDTEPQIEQGQTILDNIKYITEYGDTKFRWLFEMMEDEERNDPKRQQWLNSVESFAQGGYFIEMATHTKKLSNDDSLSKNDRKVYHQLNKLFYFMQDFHN